MTSSTKKTWFIALVVSIGGFLFGFDAGIISGVMSYAGPQFDLNDVQTGWVVSSPSFSAMIAMLISCLLYTSPSPRDQRGSRMPSSA